MKRTALSLTILFTASGCASFNGPGHSTGWNDMDPPRSNALGRAIPASQGAMILGEQVVSLGPESIAFDDAGGVYQVENYNKLNADVAVAVEAVAAKLGYEYQGSTNSLSKKLQVAYIKSIRDVEALNKVFVYQCLVAGEYEFVARKKHSAEIKGGITGGLAKKEWANELGLASASVELSLNAGETVTVKVASPNVCLSYVSAVYKEQNSFWDRHTPKSRPIQATDGQSSFMLKPGTYSAKSTADVKGWSEANKPRFRLKYSLAGQDANLSICAQGGGFTDQPERCVPLNKDDEVSWSGSHPAGKYWVSNNDLSVVRVNLKASKNDDGTLTVENPRLDVSQYKLSFR